MIITDILALVVAVLTPALAATFYLLHLEKRRTAELKRHLDKIQDQNLKLRGRVASMEVEVEQAISQLRKGIEGK